MRCSWSVARGLVVWTLSVLSWTAQAAGQTLPADVRVPGLFGFGSDGGRQRLDMMVSAAAVTENDLILPYLDSSLGGLTTVPSNSFESVAVQLAYLRKFRESTFAVTGRSAMQSFPALGNNLTVERAATMGYNLQHRGTHVSAQQSVDFFPLFAPQTTPTLFSTTIAQLPQVVGAEAVASVPARRYTTDASISQSVGPRLTLSAVTRLAYTTLGSDALSLRQDMGSAQLTYQLTSGLGLVAGYTAERGSYRVANAQSVYGIDPYGIDLQNINVGVNYQHALSFSRRTTIGFSSGPVAVRDPVNRTTQYTMGGEAHLNHQIGRTWQATARYNRNVSFLDGFAAPFLGDSVAVNLAGLVTRRITLAMGGSEWLGRTVSGGQISPDRNETRIGFARVSLALSRTMALTGEGRFVRYRFNTPPAFLTAIPLWFDQPSVQIGFDLWLPLFH